MRYLLVWLLWGIGIVWPLVVGAVVLVSPPEGAVYTVGSNIIIRVEAGPGEELKVMMLGLHEVQADPSGKFVELQKRFRENADLGKGPLEVYVGYFVGGQPREVTLTRNITVVLPSTTVLQGLRIRDDQKKMFMTVGEKRPFYLYGQFSDSVERDVSSASMGTTSQSSDEKVAIFNSEEGLIEALSVGKATLTVTNGSHEIKVPVFVEKALGLP